jgi:hypothetical protein
MYLQEPVLNGLFCLEWLSVVPLKIFDTNTLGVNELVCEANHKIDKIIDQLNLTHFLWQLNYHFLKSKSTIAEKKQFLVAVKHVSHELKANAVNQIRLQQMLPDFNLIQNSRVRFFRWRAANSKRQTESA